MDLNYAQITLFVHDLFESLNHNNIRYAILRNYESLPEKPTDSDYFDLDLLVNSHDLKRYIKIVYDMAKRNKLAVIKKIDREYCKTIRVVFIDKNGNVGSVQLDSHVTGQNWWGFLYLSEEQILDDRILYKSFYVVSDFHRHLFNWLDKLLFGNYIKQKYKSDILRTFKERNQEFSSFLNKVFGLELTNRLKTRFKSGDLEGTLVYRRKMINKLLKYSLINFPFLTIFSVIKFFYFEIRLYLFPPGVSCLFDESHSSLIKNNFKESKKIFLGDQIILNYKDNSLYSWLKFYFEEVFPIVRKGGLVFITINKNSNFIFKKKLQSSISNLDLLYELIESNKTNVIAGSVNLYVPKILD
tara:strand:- start:518 stop:1585 length:1068 start_codon:yes stop_codon:yes gene_type:complete